MSNELRHRNGEGVSQQLLAGASSHGARTGYDLVTPLSDWSLQVVAASTDVIVTMDLSLQSSSGAAFESKLTWATTAGQASGDLVHLSTTVGRQVRANLTQGGSSGGVSAWFAGV